MKIKTGMEVFLIPRQPFPKMLESDYLKPKTISLISDGYIEFTDGTNARIDLGDRLFIEYTL